MNKVILMGRLTKDPELRFTSGSNTAVCNFTIAVNRQFQKQGEERKADFLPVVAWSKNAEFCGKYFTKGQQVAIVGRLETRTWDDNEGKKHYITEVIAEEAHFADSKRSGEGPAERTNSGAPGGGQSDGFYPVDDDDELPF
jgi:single-strand DNA-binding protein